MLAWFQNGPPPLYLAPMAGVTDRVFRSLCKELGADVMVTEFVSAEGIMQADHRTRRYTEFDEGSALWACNCSAPTAPAWPRRPARSSIGRIRISSTSISAAR
jgi:tRNA-dihydrouridine synthase